MTADVLEIIWASDVSKIIKCWEENKKKLSDIQRRKKLTTINLHYKKYFTEFFTLKKNNFRGKIGATEGHVNSKMMFKFLKTGIF